MKDVLNSWKFRHLTVFGKLTIIKTLCISKLTQIKTVIVNLCVNKINEIKSCWEDIIKTNGCTAVGQNTRYNTKKNLWLGMLKITDFWQAVQLSWL